MKSNALKLALPVIAALVAGSGVASAATYTYSGYNVTNEQGIHITSPNNISGGMGQIVLTGSLLDIGNNLAVWCLDVFDWLQGSGTYNSGNLSSSVPNGNTFATLSATQQSEIASLAAHGNAHIGDSFNASAAIQLAIWEVEYSTFAFTSVSSSVVNLANLYLTAVGAGGIWDAVNNTYTASLLASDRPCIAEGTGAGACNQSMAFIGAGQGFVANPTPLPSTWTMLIAGFVGLGFLAYRRTKKNTAAFAAA